MASLRRFLQRLAASFRSHRADTDLTREIASHLQLLEDQFKAQGMTPEDARYAARRAFGGVEQVKERQRDVRSFRWLTGWPMDLKLGVRMLAKTPGLTVIAVAALAVAVGAGAAYHEFMRDMINPTLRVAAAERLVGIQIWDPEQRTPRLRALHEFATWRPHFGALEHFGAASEFERHLITSEGRTDLVQGAAISAAAFRMVPVAPLLGRTLGDGDERPGAEAVVVIGHELWQTRFDADTNVVGRTVRLGSTVHTIVGVMPGGFAFPINQNLWTPLKVEGAQRGEGPAIQMFGRLKEGVSAEAAQAALQGLLNPSEPLRADVRPYLDSLLAEDREGGEATILYIANLIFVMLLGICGVNVAALVFARTAMREAEITVRTALGASRGRICAQLFAEALVLSGVGALAGLAVARFLGLWAKQVWVENSGEPLPFWWDDSFSPQTLLYTAALAVFAALIVGVIPALKATGPQLQGRLREAGAAGSSMTLGGLWTGVIVVQVGFTMVFLALAASLAWTAIRAHYGIGVAYPREQFLTARLTPDGSRPGPSGRSQLSAETVHAIVDRLKTEPGVVGVTYATAIPGTSQEWLRLEFAEPEVANSTDTSDAPWSDGARVGMNFFETLDIPLVSGRLFTPAEILGGHHVAIVNEAWVSVILGGRNPLGLLVRQPAADGGTPGPWHQIIGVVGDTTITKREKTREVAVLYRPAAPGAGLRLRLLMRMQDSASAQSHRLQAAALAADADVRLADVMSLDRLAEVEAGNPTFFLQTVAVASAVALLLSAAGIYALISFTVARRTREIGIRIALGAVPKRIVTTVFSRAITQIGLGVLAGAIPSVVLLREHVDARFWPGLLIAVIAAAAIGAFVILVAMASCAAPMRRAMRIEPTEALRVDA